MWRSVAVALLLLLVLAGPVAAADGDDDNPSEVSWSVWAARIDEIAQPVVDSIDTVNLRLEETSNDVCETLGGAEFIAGGDYWSDEGMPALAEDASIAQTAYYMGFSIGRPIGYLRAVQDAGTSNLNYLNMLIAFALGGVGWIVFVMTGTLGIRLVMALVQTALRLWELLAFT